jgi:hypothetical protein
MNAIPIKDIRLRQLYYATYTGPRIGGQVDTVSNREGYIFPYEKKGSDLYFYECGEFPKNTGRMLCDTEAYVKTSDVKVYDLERIKDPMPHLTGGRHRATRRRRRRDRATRRSVKKFRRHM